MPREPARDANIAELSPQRDTTTTTTTAAATDWSGWERWLKGHLVIELGNLHRALGVLLATERKKFHDRLERKTSEFEVKLAKLSGAIDVLRGAAPPPPPRFPSVKAWAEDTVYHEGDVVTFAGGTYQAKRDTGRAPGSQDWICLAVAGAGFTVRGTYDWNETYKHFDVVVLNGSSFVALKDNPGPCPGEGWHLLASRGSRGSRGERGPVGLGGARGERGEAAPMIRSWEIDRARYTATPIMSDFSRGPLLELRGLFEQFLLETQS